MARRPSTDRVSVRLHGVSLALTSTYPAFLDYAAMALAPYTTADEDSPDVTSHLDWVEQSPSASLQQAFGVAGWERRPDRDLYLYGENAYWLRIDDFRALQLAAAWNGKLRLTGRYHFSLGADGLVERVRRLRWAARMDRLRARRFSTLLYYLVYYPVLWWLSRYRSLHVLHAGAVAKGTRAVVFAGMPGCGKSTLAVAMLADRDCRMLSDNLIVYGDSEVRACPELLLLDRSSLALVGDARSRLLETGDRRVFDRDAFRVDVTEMGPVTPSGFFCVERGTSAGCVRIDTAEAIRRMQAGNVMAKEVRRLGIMAEVLDLIADPPSVDAQGVLSRLVSGVPAYVLTVGEGGGPEAYLTRHVRPCLDTRSGEEG